MGRRAGEGEAERGRLRLLKFLSGGPAIVGPSSGTASVLLENGDNGTIAVRTAQLAASAHDGLLCREGRAVRLSDTGRAALRRALAEKDAHRAQHGDIVPRRFDTPEGWVVADVDLSESPLSQLARRKAKDGKPFLSAAELRAGERLRSDYTRARIMPRLGANWQAAIASGRRGGGAGGAVELTDAVLSARQRVERAIEAVGPELSGILIDVCCFLKGLGTVEMEREWPVRSAKIILKSALAALSRHYEPSRNHARRVLHWGTEDYRPRLE